MSSNTNQSDLTSGKNSARRRWPPGDADCPPPLKQRLAGLKAGAVTIWGDTAPLQNDSLAFFCSVRCPGDIILKTYDLARALRDVDPTLIGGFQSPMEKECLTLLLRGKAPIVVCPARGLGHMRLPAEWKTPLAEGRLLLLSFFDDKIRRPTAALAAQRNARVAALADRLLIAHAEPGGKIESICRTALAQRKPVFTLESPENEHLVALGAVPVPANKSSMLIGGAGSS